VPWITWITTHPGTSLLLLCGIVLIGIIWTIRAVERRILYEREKMIEDILGIVNGHPETGGLHPHLTTRYNRLIHDEFEQRLDYLRAKRKRATH